VFADSSSDLAAEVLVIGIKNKKAPPKGEAELFILFRSGKYY